MQKILYVDMDNVLVDFKTGIDKLDENLKLQYADRLDETPGIFGLMDPIPDAIDAYQELSRSFNTYILSTSPWNNPSAWHDKIVWVQKHLGAEAHGPAYKRLILSHHKNLNHGDFLVDDREKNGADRFTGELILFGSTKFPDWKTVKGYLLDRK
ncbi:MAG TPA: hypothetical protein VK489_08265 [Ferruginibacter sp.]|nr:hypothetical protein [Ferruginibacter sp.]